SLVSYTYPRAYHSFYTIRISISNSNKVSGMKNAPLLALAAALAVAAPAAAQAKLNGAGATFGRRSSITRKDDDPAAPPLQVVRVREQPDQRHPRHEAAHVRPERHPAFPVR